MCAGAEQNVELVRRYYILTSGDLAGIEDIVSADFLDHHFPPTLPQGPEGVKAFFTDVLGAFTNRRIDIFDIFATDDRVGVRFDLVADQTGEFAGYKPSGQQITCGAMSMFRVENGKLVEGWESADLFGLFNQLQALQSVAA
jgi:predicted ester cyclase